MEIRTTPLTVSQLLHSTNEQFVIPPYQRRYSWQKKQIVQLFDDIQNLDMAETHFLGNIVCLTDSHTAGVNPLELVDGQQRMTTLILVLDTIKDCYEEAGDTREAERIEDLLYASDIDRKRINKLILGDLDHSDYKSILEQKDLESVKNKRLLEAHQNIKFLVDTMTKDDLYGFKEKLINHTNIVRLDVSRARDAFKLFETINNRGLSLSPTDIIKNFLLGHASLVDDETLNKVRTKWTKIIVNLDGQNLDDFFRQYLMGVTGAPITFAALTDSFKKHYISRVKKSEILGEYREYSEEGERGPMILPEVFIAELESASMIYSKILNCSFDDNDINREIAKIHKISAMPSYTLILTMMKGNIPKPEIIKILKMIQVFMLRRLICDYRTSEADKIFPKLARETESNLLETVKAAFSEPGKMPGDKEFEEKLIAYDFFGRFMDRAKCMLEEIEYKLSGNTQEKAILGGDKVHLEHIMPQTITTKKAKNELGDWVRYLGQDSTEEHPKYVSKIGNMTLLAGDINITASNNPFEAKQKLYKKSDIKITRELLKYDHFGFDEIQARSKKIARQSAKIWKI
jgi:uncharacterized protein with ParB-like and HNH nuclease domain